MKNNKKIFLFYIALTLVVVFSSPALANEQNISIEFEHIIFERQGDNIISVRDMIDIKNLSDEDVFSDIDNPKLKVSVPFESIHLQVLNRQGAEISHLLVEDEVILEYELPAERILEFDINYFFALENTGKDISITREYPIKSLNVYVPANSGLVIKSPQLVDAGARSIDQRTFNYYTIANVEAGVTIEATIEKVQQNENVITNDRVNQGYDGFHNPGHIRFWENSPFSAVNPHLFTLFVVVLIVFAIVNYFYRWHMDDKKIKEQQQGQDDDIFIRLYKEEAVLKKKLTELQIKLDNDEIDEEEFSKRKDIYKKKLINVKLKIKEFTE